MLDDDPDEAGPDVRVLSTSTHVARKPLPCDLADTDADGDPVCGIGPSMRYQRVAMMTDGVFRVHQNCLRPCPKALPAMAKTVPAWGSEEEPF